MAIYYSFTKENDDQRKVELGEIIDSVVILFNKDSKAVDVYFGLKELYNKFTDMLFFGIWGDHKS